MTIQISGRNVDIGDATRTHIENRISEALEKYYPGAFTGHVTIGREGGGFRSECILHLSTGVVLQVSGDNSDARQSFDIAAERIEKRLRRYKRKLKAHHSTPNGIAFEDVNSYVLADPEAEEEVPADYNPVVVAETKAKVKTLTVGMAVMELDLSEAPVVVFRNAGSGAVNVVYRRDDGNVGWIDPGMNGAEASA
ncbi:ribosome hibernation-promoting factor, HPF/YfiA family [Polycladidibacter hongkongensis]|uniref:ribosome hibernation-promoting factor, HPF/YfiA family n=1 Tax=Polycladidibacter hongkongensis TaxID=1647556 RepID=UPI00082AD04B|nr:ribosome-associated translation inhibitor RaiA [Pseudovibrio hongkongensis]